MPLSPRDQKLYELFDREIESFFPDPPDLEAFRAWGRAFPETENEIEALSQLIGKHQNLFSGYDTTRTFTGVAESLTAEEMAELLEAYQNPVWSITLADLGKVRTPPPDMIYLPANRLQNGDTILIQNFVGIQELERVPQVVENLRQIRSFRREPGKGYSNTLLVEWTAGGMTFQSEFWVPFLCKTPSNLRERVSGTYQYQ